MTGVDYAGKNRVEMVAAIRWRIGRPTGGGGRLRCQKGWLARSSVVFRCGRRNVIVWTGPVNGVGWSAQSAD